MKCKYHYSIVGDDVGIVPYGIKTIFTPKRLKSFEGELFQDFYISVRAPYATQDGAEFTYPSKLSILPIPKY